MSMWTHIVAAIDWDTFVETDDLVEFVAKELGDAPKITGSEIDAEIFINQLEGYNVSTSCDCNRCAYKYTIKEHYCDAPDGFVCPDGRYQTRVVITIIGDLRDRMKEQTEQEWSAFKTFIENKRGDIRNISCNIQGW